MSIQIRETALTGVLLIEPRCFRDERGFFKNRTDFGSDGNGGVCPPKGDHCGGLRPHRGGYPYPHCAMIGPIAHGTRSSREGSSDAEAALIVGPSAAQIALEYGALILLALFSRRGRPIVNEATKLRH
jgi:hypothetical protein